LLNNRLLAFICGLITGGFLYLQFGWDSNAAFVGWKWYQGAALLGGIGFAGIFREEARLSAALGMGIAPLLVAWVQEWLHFARDPTCCNLWPIGLAMVLMFSFPAPVIGSGIGRVLMRSQLARTVSLIPLISSLVIAALLPKLQNAERQKLENETIPGLLRQIYGAERIYSASQPDGHFACEGTLLPGAAGKLGWGHGGAKTTKNIAYFTLEHYTIRLDCPNDTAPRTFRVQAFSHEYDVPGSRFVIDQTGVLTQSDGSSGPASSEPEK
jgi:hypothetical protein